MNWYEIKAKSDVSEIWLYEQIGKDWFGDGLTAKDFLKELNAIKSEKIDLHINSPGGQVFEGTAIYNGIKNHPAETTAYIDGIAASIASVIALAGKKVVMAENAMFMMHLPSGVVMGTATDMRKTADALDKIRDSMVTAYVSKSKKSTEDVTSMMDEETWFTAAEAKEAGFADEVGSKKDLEACAKFVPVMAKMQFKHIPREIIGQAGVPAAKDLERALRDVGCSVKQAKSILAKGYSDALRDVEPPEPAPAAPAPRDVEPPPPARRDRATTLLEEADAILTRRAQ